MYEELNRCFTLRVRPFVREHDPRLIIIHAFDEKGWDESGRVRLDIEVRHGGKVIFPRGQLYGAVHGCSDSKAAKEHALAMAAMKPGDTDEEFFADYTPEQIAWVELYGETLSAEREARYCDPETGSVRA